MNFRLRREDQTIQVMTEMYCRHRHSSTDLCPECATFLKYARTRVEKCRYGENKPACSECPTHCYAPAQRETVRTIMRFSGPRMMLRHPILALFHLWDKYISRKRLEKHVIEKSVSK